MSIVRFWKSHEPTVGSLRLARGSPNVGQLPVPVKGSVEKPAVPVALEKLPETQILSAVIEGRAAPVSGSVGVAKLFSAVALVESI